MTHGNKHDRNIFLSRDNIRPDIYTEFLSREVANQRSNAKSSSSVKQADPAIDAVADRK